MRLICQKLKLQLARRSANKPQSAREIRVVSQRELARVLFRFSVYRKPKSQMKISIMAFC